MQTKPEEDNPRPRRKLIKSFAIGGIGAAALALLGLLKLAPSGNPRKQGQDYTRYVDTQIVDTQSSTEPELRVENLSGGFADLTRNNEAAPDYTIWTISSITYMKEGTNGVVTATASADALATIQAALDALPSTGGVICLKDMVSATGLLTINKSNVTLEHDRRYSYQATSDNPSITQIKLDATSGGLNAIKIEGLNIKELDFCANGQYIIGVSVDNCLIQKDSTYHGVVFQGDGTTSGFVDDISFFRTLFINHGGSTDGAKWGLVSWVSTPSAMTQCVFNNCTFEMYDTPQTVFHCDGGSRINSLNVTNCRIHTQKTANYVLYTNTPTIAGVIGFDAMFSGNYFETGGTGAPMTLVYLETRGAAFQFWMGVNFTANHFELGSGGLILMTYADGAGATWGQSGSSLMFMNNKINSYGIRNLVSVGMLPSLTVFFVLIRNNSPYFLFNTENSGTSTGTGSQQTIAHGLVTTPTLVLLSEGTTGGALPYQSATADATNIYVTATLNKTYTWYAKVY